MKSDFEAQKQALLGEIRTVLDEVENLYQAGAERSAEENAGVEKPFAGALGRGAKQIAKIGNPRSGASETPSATRG